LSRLIAVFVALCAAVAVTVAASGPSAAVGDCTPQQSWGAVDRSAAQQVLSLVNQHRASRGLSQLTSSPSLTASAEWKSLHMSGYGYFAHDDPAPPVSRSVGQRLVACGYPTNAGWGENIAYGYATPSAVMQGWLNSPGHRANIENASYRTLGIGVARNSAGRLYWTQDFGTSTAGSTPPPSPPSPPPAPVPPAVDTQAPSTPTGLTVTGATRASISVRWNASGDNRGVSGYGVYVGSTRVGTAAGLTATIGGRACGTSYSLGVDAYDAAGNRSGRAVVTAATSPCATPPPPSPPPPSPPPSPPPATPPPPAPAGDTTPPSTPASLSVVSKTTSSVTVQWTPSTDNVGVTGYQLYRSGLPVGTSQSLTFTYSGLTCGSWQVLSVRARDAAGNLSERRQILTPLDC
jgi:uncharacterized protein YkwD/chitodextrinase